MVVTGGGRGIGAATALLAAEQGYQGLRELPRRTRIRRDSLAKRIERHRGPGGRLIRSRRRASLREVDRKLGRVTALVNNAGIVDRGTRVENMTAARIARMFAINVTGSFLCAREAIKRMSTRHGGTGGAIVNVSSIAAKLGGAGRVRRLRRVEGRDRHLHHRPGEGSRRRGHPRQRGAARHHPHRDPRLERRPGAPRAHRRHGAARRGPARPKKWRAPSSGCCPTRRPTSPARWSTSPAAADLGGHRLRPPRARRRAASRALALALSKKLPLEIVSIDSAQVYRGMDIGTAKPSAAERAAVPHHLIDLIDPDQSYSAGQWREAAIRCVGEILEQKEGPACWSAARCSTTAPGMPASTRCRRPMPRCAREIDAEAARARLAGAARRAGEGRPGNRAAPPPNDAQRIQRALEVFRLTGKPLSALQGARDRRAAFRAARRSPSSPRSRDAARRIEERFDAMLQARAGRRGEERCASEFDLNGGDAEHARGRLPAGLGDASKERPTRRPCASERIAATRQLAKRQLTWLRSFPDLVRLDAGGAQDAAVALELLLDQIGKPLGRAGR